MLIWDPAGPGAAPAELGRHDGPVQAVAVLADGRVVTGGSDGRVLVWDPAGAGAAPPELGRFRASSASAELGRHYGFTNTMAVLADGRVVTGGTGGRVLIWDPAGAGAAPAELGRHDGPVQAVAVLADGRVVTGGTDRRVLIWDPARACTQVIQLSCSLATLATAPPGPARSELVIAHEGSGFSLWSFTGLPARNTAHGLTHPVSTM